jgi:hypothetical protein
MMTYTLTSPHYTPPACVILPSPIVWTIAEGPDGRVRATDVRPEQVDAAAREVFAPIRQ